MNLPQIIVYKHRDEQSFVHTCVAVLTPDSLIVKCFVTLCIPDFKKIKEIKKSDLNLKNPNFFF